MPCEPLFTADSTVVGIACGPARRYRRFYGHCEACGRRRSMVRRWDGMYYGYTEYCLGCGTYWMDGMPCDEDHRDRKTAARWWNEWNDAMPAGEFDAWVREYQRSYFEDDDELADPVKDRA